jgi:hypothetical protein
MTPIQIAGFVAFAVAMWTGVGYLIGIVSGWQELARSYRCARINVVEVDVDSQGLYLATFPLFRVGFPPLHIPWQDISVKPGKLFFWNYVEFRFRQAPSVFLQLPADLVRKMAAEVGDDWPVDRGAAMPF